MADRWLLIETFGGEGHSEPSVIAVGRTVKKMVPLASLLGRGRYLDDVRALVARVAGDPGACRSRFARWPPSAGREAACGGWPGAWGVRLDGRTGRGAPAS